MKHDKMTSVYLFESFCVNANKTIKIDLLQIRKKNLSRRSSAYEAGAAHERRLLAKRFAAWWQEFTAPPIILRKVLADFCKPDHFWLSECPEPKNYQHSLKAVSHSFLQFSCNISRLLVFVSQNWAASTDFFIGFAKENITQNSKLFSKKEHNIISSQWSF